MRKYYLLCILLLSFVSCDNSSTGNGVSNTTNSGDDTSDFVDNETWSSTINIVWNGTDVTVTGSGTYSHPYNRKGSIECRVDYSEDWMDLTGVLAFG